MAQITNKYVLNQCINILYMLFDVKISREFYDYNPNGSIINPFYKEFMPNKYKTIKIIKIKKLLYCNLEIITNNILEYENDLLKNNESNISIWINLYMAYYCGVLNILCNKLLSITKLNDDNNIRLISIQRYIIDFEKNQLEKYVQYHLLKNNNEIYISYKDRKDICDNIAKEVIVKIANSAFSHIRSFNKTEEIKKFYYEQDIYAMWLDLIMRTLISIDEHEIPDYEYQNNAYINLSQKLLFNNGIN